MIGAQIGNVTLDIQTSTAIVDTGTSYLLVPTQDFNKITQYFTSRDHLCGMDNRNSLFTCLCSEQLYENFPDIKIQLGNNKYTMPKESYIQFTGGKCYFLIMRMNFNANEGFWILGDNFL
jgi:hypothetical protein